MSATIHTYHERIPELRTQLAERGSLGIAVIDASAMARIEDEYGSDAYEEVRQRLYRILNEARGKDYRAEDSLALDAPRPTRHRRPSHPHPTRYLPTTHPLPT